MNFCHKYWIRSLNQALRLDECYVHSYQVKAINLCYT